MAYLLLPGRRGRGSRPVSAFQLDRERAGDAGLIRYYPLANGHNDLREYVGGVSRLVNTGAGFTGWTGHGAPAAITTAATYLTGDTPPVGSVPNLTVAAWCLTTTTSSSGGGGGLRYIVSNEITGGGQYILRYSPSAGVFQGLIQDASASGFASVSGSTTVVANVPYLVVLTFTGTTITLYVNGKSDGTGVTGAQNTRATAQATVIGSDSGFNSRLRQWQGWISDVFISLQALSAPQVWALYEPKSRWDFYWVPGRQVVVDALATFDAALFPHREWPLPPRGRDLILPSGRIA